jgi:hypothetical protein
LIESYRAALCHNSEDLFLKLCLFKTLNLKREVLSVNTLWLAAKDHFRNTWHCSVGVLYACTERTCVSTGSKSPGFRSTTFWNRAIALALINLKKFPAEFLCLKTLLLSIQREETTALVHASNRYMVNIVGDCTFAEMAIVYNICGVHRDIKLRRLINIRSHVAVTEFQTR